MPSILDDLLERVPGAVGESYKAKGLFQKAGKRNKASHSKLKRAIKALRRERARFDLSGLEAWAELSIPTVAPLTGKQRKAEIQRRCRDVYPTLRAERFVVASSYSDADAWSAIFDGWAHVARADACEVFAKVKVMATTQRGLRRQCEAETSRIRFDRKQLRQATQKFLEGDLNATDLQRVLLVLNIPNPART